MSTDFPANSYNLEIVSFPGHIPQRETFCSAVVMIVNGYRWRLVGARHDSGSGAANSCRLDVL